jgi:uncharacterized repeat protein (TIGR01451 family)
MMRRGFSPLLSRLLLLVAAVTLTATVLTLGASAAPAPAPYANGFENAADVDAVTYPNDAINGAVTRVASGTGGIPSSSGGWYAVADTNSGAFTRYGGYSSVFPAGGYTTSADIYLDTSASPLAADLRFDWDSAISDPAGHFRRDFVFNVATDGLGGFVVAGSNNAGRSGANPLVDPNRITISRSGWYTFQHRFYSNNGVLAVEMTVSAAGSTTPLETWTRSDPTDVIGTTVGGNRYGWLVTNELPLALDNITRSGVSADLSIVKTDSPDPVYVGDNLTYTLAVHNAGPDSADAVTVSDTLPSGTTYVSANSSAGAGSCTGTSTVTCSLGSLASGANATATIVVTANAPGTLSNTATVSSTTYDPASANNSSQATTAVAACRPTGFMRDGIDLTARQIGGTVTGTLDATGCNIGAYNPTSVTGATIFGANYYGVVVNAATTNVNISNTTIHDIGESPFNGAQHGVGVLYNAASGTLSGSSITRYQKNGVVVAGTHAAVTVKNNTVTGNGQINYIAQNGIEIASGASASVMGNTVSGNWYTPTTYTACGLLFIQAGGVKQSGNTLYANETNLCNAGRGGGNFNP